MEFGEIYYDETTKMTPADWERLISITKKHAAACLARERIRQMQITELERIYKQ
jgi:hypothetical protein